MVRDRDRCRLLLWTSTSTVGSTQLHIRPCHSALLAWRNIACIRSSRLFYHAQTMPIIMSSDVCGQNQLTVNENPEEAFSNWPPNE